MELNITIFFLEARHSDYSASPAEIGQDAGRITWHRAIEDEGYWNLLDSADKLESFADYAVSTGGWTGEEVDRMSNRELQALCIQFVAGWVREAFGDDTTSLTDEDWSDYYARAEQGECTGVFSRDAEGKVFCYFGI